MMVVCSSVALPIDVHISTVVMRSYSNQLALDLRPPSQDCHRRIDFEKPLTEEGMDLSRMSIHDDERFSS
jgi:hypothetical protein